MTVPLYNLTDTWNSGATVFTAILMNVTDSASDAASLLMDLQVAASSKFSVTKAGAAKALTYLLVPSDSTSVFNVRGTAFATTGINVSASSGGLIFGGDGAGVTVFVNDGISIRNTGSIGWDITSAGIAQSTSRLYQAGTSNSFGVIEQRYTTLPQTLRVYNTYTDSSNYERGIFDWNATANTLTIGTQAAGTGTARAMTVTAAASPLNVSVPSGGNIYFNVGGVPAFAVRNTQNAVVNYNSWAYGWGSSDASSAPDTGIVRTAAGVIAFGNGTTGDSSATIKAKTKAGAPTTGDVPAGTWALIRDTTNLTTAIYYNNAGALQSVALT